jgi:hypothetical protein
VPNLASLIAAEYAFAALSPSLGTRGAFLAYLADDSVLFRPRPVRGKAWMESQPARPGVLTWYPSFACLARAGDLGVSSGPWEYRRNSLNEEPIAHGYFVSMWRVQTNGEWKVEIDCGIGCPPPTAPIDALQPETVSEPPVDETASSDLEQVCAALLGAECALAAEAARAGMPAAYDNHIVDQARVYRDEAWPSVGREAIRLGLSQRAGSIVWRPVEARASKSGDLGYVYGLAQFTPADGGARIESCYLRVWQPVDEVWRVLVDVDNLIPPEA